MNTTNFSCILILMIFLLPLTLFSQNSDFQSGARSQSMGNASITNSDTWSIFNNIGSLADEQEMSIAISYSSYYQMEGFKSVAIASHVPVNRISFGTGIYYFGDEVYNEGKVSFGASHKINYVSLGISLNYLQYNVLDFGSANAWVVEMGGKVQIHPSLQFGAHIFNINQASLTNQQRIKIPTVMRAGLSYKPSETAMLCVEIEKDPDKPSSVRSGFEYGVIKQVLLRSGITTYPTSGHFGIGFIAKKTNIDYALSHHNSLGLSHQLSAIIKIKKRNNESQ